MNELPESDRPGLSVTTESKETEFYRVARGLVSDLFVPNEKRYWVDFTLSAVMAYVCASFFLALPLTSGLAWVAFFAAVLTIYRASMFIHEIAHMPQDQMKGFKLFWNIFAGIPMMIPAFTYESHTHHHSSRHYGTEHDGEYLPFARGTVWGILAFFAQVLFQPLLVFLRYLIGTPVSFLHPQLRKYFYRHATSLVINFKYQKNVKPGTFTTENTILEIACSFRTWVMILLVVFGVMPPIRLPKLLMLAIGALVLNHIRTLSAHRYRSDGRKVSHLDQFLDSTNITGSWLTELIFPCGLRYHALHHLFPGIPYHNLGKAHRRLMAQLPKESVYHENVYPNLLVVLKELWNAVRANPRDGVYLQRE